MDGDEEVVADVDVEEEAAAAAAAEVEAGTDLLLAGPETLILARPGDKVEDVDGEEEDKEEGDMGGRVFMACPARRVQTVGMLNIVMTL